MIVTTGGSVAKVLENYSTMVLMTLTLFSIVCKSQGKTNESCMVLFSICGSRLFSLILYSTWKRISGQVENIEPYLYNSVSYKKIIYENRPNVLMRV